jgi:hypothetical protein
MSRIHARLSSYRVTPLGWIFLLVIAVSLGLGFLGPHEFRVPGLAIGFIGLVMVVAEHAGVASRPGLPTARRASADDVPISPVTEPEAVEAGEDAWRRERERRDRERRDS